MAVGNGQTWSLVWDPLELIVSPGGVPIPLACWCELQLSVHDPQALQAYLGSPSGSPENWKQMVQERLTPSVCQFLQRAYTRQDWRQYSLTRGSVEQQVKQQLDTQTPPGLTVERFLIRSICTFEEYLDRLALRNEVNRKLQAQRPQAGWDALPEHQAQGIYQDLPPQIQQTLSPQESQQGASIRLNTLSQLVSGTGEVILAGKYKLEAPLGRGGMGVVWKAWDLMGERWVAIKFLPSPMRQVLEEIEAFRKHFQTICNLHHQYICPVYALDRDDRIGNFLVMQYVPGVSAEEYRKQYLQRNSPVPSLPPEILIGILRPVAEALDYVHQQSIVHRDIKPSNILVVPNPKNPDQIQTVQVIDFGLAATIHTSLSRIQSSRGLQPQAPAGTPAYISPEQWEGKAAAQSDQYSLAVVAYELLSGQLPFPQTDIWVLRLSVLKADPPPISGYSRPVQDVFNKALGKTPAQRYATCCAFVDALDKALQQEPSKKTKPPKKEEPLPSSPSSPPPGHAVRCLEGDWLDWSWVANHSEASGWQASGELPPEWKCREWGALCGVAPLGSSRLVIPVVRTEDSSEASLAAAVEIQSLADFFKELGFHPTEPGIFREPDLLGKSEFCCVPGGLFVLGYHPNKQRNDWLRSLRARGFQIDEQAAYREWPGGVGYCNSFLISRFKLTNVEYAEFVQSGGGPRPPHWSEDRPPRGTERHPVTHISYEDARAYCEWKTRKAHEAGLSLVYRLPTHWEWEKAARGACTRFQTAWTEATEPNGPGRIYPWGDEFRDTCLNSLSGRGRAGISDADSLQGVPTPWKVCELVGNAYEWVEGGRLQSGKIFPCLRGVPWNAPGECLGLSFYQRVYGAIDFRAENLGFRCVILPSRDTPPQQICVPLGKCQFTDGSGRTQTVDYRFGLARFAVTNEEFQKFRPDHQYPPSERWSPVVNVGWEEAKAFCQWKSQQEGRRYRLPLRWEWELACRGVQGRKYPWGDEYVRYWCNSLESGWGRPIQVDTLPQGASPEGIYHLCGNVFEWLDNGEAVGGAYNATCETYGAPPYADVAHGRREGQPFIGFRYVTVLPS